MTTKKKNERWTAFKEWSMLYIDQLVDVYWNMFKVGVLLLFLVVIMWIPPVTRKVHASIWKLLEGGSIMEAFITFKLT